MIIQFKPVGIHSIQTCWYSFNSNLLVFIQFKPVGIHSIQMLFIQFKFYLFNSISNYLYTNIIQFNHCTYSVQSVKTTVYFQSNKPIQFNHSDFIFNHSTIFIQSSWDRAVWHGNEAFWRWPSLNEGHRGKSVLSR